MAKKISCPECKQKFRTKTGRDWHLDHIHSLPKQSTILVAQTGTQSLAIGKVTANIPEPAGLQPDLLKLKRQVDDIEEMAKCRLDVGLKPAVWLSERISALEENRPNLHRTESR